jgi:hypothetical protein
MIRARMNISAYSVNKLFPAQGSEVKFHAVYTPDKSNPNFTWSQATPSGELRLNITNVKALEQLDELIAEALKMQGKESGAEFYIDIYPAPKEDVSESS